MKRIYILFCCLCACLVSVAQVQPHPTGVPIRTTDPGSKSLATAKVALPMKTGAAAPKTLIPPKVIPLKNGGWTAYPPLSAGASNGSTTGTMAAQPAAGQMNPANGAAATSKMSQPATSQTLGGKPGNNTPSSVGVKQAQPQAPVKTTN